MKQAIIFAILSIGGLLAHANTSVFFKADTVLPKELQVKIAEAIEQKCPRVSGAEEVFTQVQMAHSNEGTTTDQTFKTYFNARYFFDGAHPISITMTVNSQFLDIARSNPENATVTTVTASDETACQ